MSQGDRALGHQDHVPAVNSLVRTGPSAQPQHPSPQEFTNRFSSGREQNLPNAGACRILTQTGRGDNHTAPPVRAKKLPWPQRLTCIPSSSLLMHQKLSASMLRKTSWDRFVTSKFSTSSSAKGRRKSIREMRGTRDTGQTQGLCQAKALQEALQDSLCVRDVPGTVTAPVHSPTPPTQLKNPKRLAGHALNPVQLPREPREGSHSTFVILLGQGLCRDKGCAGTKLWHTGTPWHTCPGGQQVSASWEHHRENWERGNLRCSQKPEKETLSLAWGSTRELPVPAPSWILHQSTTEAPSLEAASFEEELP